MFDSPHQHQIQGLASASPFSFPSRFFGDNVHSITRMPQWHGQSMFNLFSSPKIIDPVLGTLVRSRGFWRGTLMIDHYGEVPIALVGGRAAPERDALIAARSASVEFQNWRARIERSLFEHYQAYADANRAEEMSPVSESFQAITSSSELWPNVSIEFLLVSPLDGLLTIELGIRVGWDEEHTVGARIRSGELMELCGSTVRP